MKNLKKKQFDRDEELNRIVYNFTEFNKQDKSIKRVDKVLKGIRKLWKAHPELRLMQLLGNVLHDVDESSYYYIEDDYLERCLRDYILIKGVK